MIGEPLPNWVRNGSVLSPRISGDDVYLDSTTPSTSTTTGSFTTLGGIGVAGDTYTDGLNVVTSSGGQDVTFSSGTASRVALYLENSVNTWSVRNQFDGNLTICNDAERVLLFDDDIARPLIIGSNATLDMFGDVRVIGDSTTGNYGTFDVLPGGSSAGAYARFQDSTGSNGFVIGFEDGDNNTYLNSSYQGDTFWYINSLEISGGAVSITDTTSSTSSTTGALTVAGGVGIDKFLNVRDGIKISNANIAETNLTVESTSVLAQIVSLNIKNISTDWKISNDSTGRLELFSGTNVIADITAAATDHFLRVNASRVEFNVNDADLDFRINGLLGAVYEYDAGLDTHTYSGEATFNDRVGIKTSPSSIYQLKVYDQTASSGRAILGEIRTTSLGTYNGLALQNSLNITGTVSVSSGSPTVTGVGTNFLELATGRSVSIDGNSYTILSITDDTTMTLTANASTTASGVTAYLTSIRVALSLLDDDGSQIGEFYTNYNKLTDDGTFNVRNKKVDSDIRFQVNDGGTTNFNALVVYGSNSYVGINTGSPSYRLDVNGNCRVQSNASSSSTTTGALIVSGGIGSGDAIFAQDEITVSAGRFNSFNNGASAGFYAYRTDGKAVGVACGTSRATFRFDSSGSFAIQSQPRSDLEDQNGSNLVNILDVSTTLSTLSVPLSITDTTASTSATTGSLRTAGGVGISENLYVGGTTVNMANLPTSASGLSAGDIWNNGGVLNIV